MCLRFVVPALRFCRFFLLLLQVVPVVAFAAVPTVALLLLLLSSLLLLLRMLFHFQSSDSDGCCSIPCLRFSLHLFNAIFLLSGVVLAAVGAHTLAEKHPALYLLSSGLYDLTGYIFLGAGCAILLFSVFGCVAICRRSHSQVEKKWSFPYLFHSPIFFI